jgi:putative ABC transport system substrate-binding protein
MTLHRLQRREVVRLLAAAGASSLIGREALAQAGAPTIGVITGVRRNQGGIDAITQGLAEAGFQVGVGMNVEYRFADDQYDKLPALAAELVARKVWAIIAVGLVSAEAAKAAAAGRIPLVFVVEADPIKLGLVSNLAQPGGNTTGISFDVSALTGTQFDLLGQLVKNPPVTGLLVNPNNTTIAKALEAVGTAHATKLVVAKASQESELAGAFAELAQQGVKSLVVPGDPFFYDSRQKLVALAAERSLPAIYPAREFAAIGGLMSYGASLLDAIRQAGIYAGFIVKGTPVMQLPVQQNTKVEFVINLDTANSLGFTIPVALLGRADSVIQKR